MSSAYVDSSCLVAVALEEERHAEMRALLTSFDRLFSSNLLEAELRAALAREVVLEGSGDLLSWVTWVYPGEALTEELESVFRAGYVRGADAWHLACALFVSPRPEDLVFLTLDQRQSEVAAALGFGTR